jgi:hypothetical protein
VGKIQIVAGKVSGLGGLLSKTLSRHLVDGSLEKYFLNKFLIHVAKLFLKTTFLCKKNKIQIVAGKIFIHLFIYFSRNTFISSRNTINYDN